MQYIGPDSSVLPTSVYGQAVWPDTRVAGDVLPTDDTGKQIYPVVRPGKHRLQSETKLLNFFTTLVVENHDQNP